MRFIKVLLLALLLLTLILGFLPDIYRFLFAGGSDVTMEMSTPNLFIQILLFIALGFLLFKKIKRSIKIIVVIIILCGWLLSSRIIGTFPDGKIITGWLYLETNRYELCEDRSDCEDVIYNKTKISTLPFWRLKISSLGRDNIIFIGPIMWRNTLSTLKKGLYKGAF